METNWYLCVNQISEMLSLISDDISKKIFWARLKVDAEWNIENIHGLLYATKLYSDEMMSTMEDAIEKLRQNETAINERRPVLIYGCGGAGRDYTKLLCQQGILVDAYCDAKKHGQLFEGKVIMSLEELIDDQKQKNYLIIIAVTFQYYEVREFLITHGISKDCILPLFLGGVPSLAPHQLQEKYVRTPYPQYFEFLDYLPDHGAFVDVGCYHGETSIEFFSLLGKKADCYSVVGFEADKTNCQITRNEFEKSAIRKYNIINAAAGEVDGIAEFVLSETSGSYLVTDEKNVNISRPVGDVQRVNVLAIDNCEILKAAVIKMDIEGAELLALKGAEQTIRRDNPMLCICVYHKAGDILAIMEYIHDIVPEYTFRIRHYSQYAPETVLYAFVES